MMQWPDLTSLDSTMMQTSLDILIICVQGALQGNKYSMYERYCKIYVLAYCTSCLLTNLLLKAVFYKLVLQLYMTTAFKHS